MSSSMHEDASPPGAYLDSPSTARKLHDISIRTCNCGYTSDHKEEYDRHILSCSQRVAKSAVDNIFRHEDAVRERPDLEIDSLLPFLNFVEDPVSHDTMQYEDPQVPPAAQLPSDTRMLQEISDDELWNRNPFLYPRYFGASQLPLQLPQTSSIPGNDPFLGLYIRNYGDESNELAMHDPSTSAAFPFPYVGPSSRPQPLPSTRRSSTLNYSTTAPKRADPLFKESGQGRSKRRLLSPEAETQREVASKRRKVDKEKQRRCRQRKADNQEALEAEVQRLRGILENLGGCAQGVEIEERNWH